MLSDLSLTESDTRAKLVTPALHRRGWNEDMIRREETAGAIEWIDGRARRGRRKRFDYVLWVTADESAKSVAVAVIEAKKNTEPPTAGMEQAKGYAKRMNVPFAFSSNGYRFVEYDCSIGRTSQPQDMREFPSPGQLRRRYEEAKKFGLAENWAKPLVMPYHGAGRRYYQDAAIRAALEKIAINEKMGARPRVLLSLATGAGKTFIAVHLLKRIADSGGLRRALFLCDRDELRKQAFFAFRKVFGDDAEEVRSDSGGNRAENARIHIATYQTLGVDSEDGDAAFLTKHYPPNHFSHIVIDECHRSAWRKWSEVLRRNPDAAHIGLTATPRKFRAPPKSAEAKSDCEITANNLKYFRDLVYEYGLAQGAEDGYLALCRIRKSTVNLDDTGISLDDVMARNPRDFSTGEPMTREELQELYKKREFENSIMLPDRVQAMCADLFANLAKSGNPLQKTIIFCVRDAHADLVVAEMNNLYAEWRRKNEKPLAEPFAFKCTSASGGEELNEFKTEDAHHFIAATVDLLSTGVDIPRVCNVVFFRYVRSPLSLHQMIGRGARIDEPSGKLSFVVHDYTNATDLLGEDEWSLPVKENGEKKEKTDEPPPVIIQVDGFDVRVSEGGSYIVVEGEGGQPRRLSAEEYRRRIAERLQEQARTPDDLRRCWVTPASRGALMDFLRERQCSPSALGALAEMKDCDEFDILAFCGFGISPQTRNERADAFDYKNEKWLNDFPAATAATLRAMAQRFADGGIGELEDGNIFETPAVRDAGGLDALRESGAKPAELLHQTKERIFAA